MKRWTMIVVAGLVVAAGVWLFVQGRGAAGQRLADGAMLRVGKIQYGRTNEFVLGGIGQEVLARILPTKGVDILGRKFKPPTALRIRHEYGEGLDFLVILSGGTNIASKVDREWQRNVRVYLRGEDDQDYEVYAPHFYAYGTASNTLAGVVQTTSFPRESRRINVRFMRQSGGKWKSFAQFAFKNPAPLRRVDWEAEGVPVSKQVGELTLKLKEVEVVPQVLPYNNMQTLTAKCPFRLLYLGEDSMKWMIQRIVMRDCTGNYEEATMRPMHGTIFQGKPGDWQDYTVYHIVNPDSVWKLDVTFCGITTNDIYTVRLPLLAPTTIITNFGSVRAMFALKSSRLSIAVLSPRLNVRLSLLSVTDESGRPVEQTGGGAYGQYELLDYGLRLSGLYTFAAVFEVPEYYVNVTVAFPAIRQAEFKINPRIPEALKGPARPDDFR